MDDQHFIYAALTFLFGCFFQLLLSAILNGAGKVVLCSYYYCWSFAGWQSVFSEVKASCFSFSPVVLLNELMSF